jgi:hypothetical protein
MRCDMATTSIKVLKRQAARCAVLAEQTQDHESRERYRRLEQMYLQFIEAEEHSSSKLPDSSIQPAA